jgi:hypothetical protein
MTAGAEVTAKLAVLSGFMRRAIATTGVPGGATVRAYNSGMLAWLIPSHHKL